MIGLHSLQLRVVALAFLTQITFPLVLIASDPIYSITYDTPLSVFAEEIARSANTKTVSVSIPVSVRFDGDATALSEVNIELESLERTCRFVDFLPKTTTVTDIAGPIRIETTTEQSGNLKVLFKAESTATGGSVGLANVQARIDADVEASRSYRELSNLKYEQLPPR